MKKILYLALIAVLSSAAVVAQPVDFQINIAGAPSVTAGAVLEITIRAMDYDAAGDGVNENMSFTGRVTLSSSVAGSIILNTGSTQTGDFNAGMWHGTITMRGAADPVTLTAVDASGATGMAYKVVTPAAYHGLRLIVPGMQFAPGTTSGFTGEPDSQVPARPFGVTVYAVDQFRNVVNSGFPSVVVEASTIASQSINPAGSVNLGMLNPPGIGYFEVTLNPPDGELPRTYPLSAIPSSGQMHTANIMIINLNDYFIWAEAPSQKTAGSYMKVTVYVSNSLYGQPVFGFNKLVRIRAFSMPSVTEANPPFTPVAEPQAAMENGVAVFNVSYTKSGAIAAVPECLGDTNIVNASQASRYARSMTLINPAAPASFIEGLYGNNVLERGKSVTVTAMLYDQYYNIVTGAAVNFEISGEGGAEGALNTTTAHSVGNYHIPGLANKAFAVFTAPDSNRVNVINVSVPGVSGIKAVSVTSILTEKFQNWPNPFKAGMENVRINYYLAEDSRVKLEILSSFGKLVWSKEFEPGASIASENHAVRGGNTYTWDGRATGGYTIGVGVYVLRITIEDSAGKRVQTRRMAVVK